MTTPTPSPARRWDRFSAAGAAIVAACAVCCAGPLQALASGIGVASSVGAVWVPALALLAVAAVVVRRRRRVSACASVPGPVELGLPTVGVDTGEHARSRTGG